METLPYNDDEDAEEELPVPQNPIVKRQIEANNNDDDKLNATQEKKKFKLIDSDSDDDDDNEKTIKAFESKVNIDQKRANRLIYLKTKFSNDDQRFKIDERFMQDDDQNDSVSKKSDDDDETSKRTVAVDEDDEDSDAKPAKVKKKEIKKENLNSLKILEQITGKQILKPTSADMEQKSLHGKKKSTTQRMIRYDPTKIEHKKYELTGRESSDEDSDDDDDDSSSSDESEKEKKMIENDEEKNKTAEVVQDTSKFYHVEPNLKSLFSSNDVFKFKFSNDHETDLEKSGSNFNFNFAETKSNKLKSSILESLKRPIAGTNVYASSSEDEYDQESETDELDNDFGQKKSGDQSDTKKAARRVDGDWQRRDVIEIKSFLPDFDNDKELKDALKYFCRSENIDTEEFRKEWLGKREKLVQECKKKNKRILRIKRIKENQKLLPWKSNKSVSGVNRHLNFNSSNGYATSSVNYNKTNSNNRKKV